MNVQSRPRMTIDAFFDWAAHRQERYELADGVPRMLPFVKRNHSIIVGNLDYALQSRIDRGVYRVSQGDFAIETGPNSIRYADVLVEPVGGDGQQRTTRRALVIAEVLSESTTHLDFGAKRSEYLGLDDLKCYLILAQDKQQAWQWIRDEDGDWPDDPKLIDQGDIVMLEIGVTFGLSELYQGVSF